MLQKYFSCCISSDTSDTRDCFIVSTESHWKSRFSNCPVQLFSLPRHVNVYVCITVWVSMCLCNCVCDFMCVCVSLKQARQQRRTGCLIGVRLRGVVSCVNSGALWLPHFHGKHLFGGLQVFNALIYTSKQHRKGIVLKGGEGLQKEGGQGNEGCFIFSFFPLRVGQGFKSMREAHWCHNDCL